MSATRIGIEAMAGETEVGDLERVWEEWVGGEVENRNLKSEIRKELRWREGTSGCLERLLEGYGMDERRRMGLVLGTTKGDLEEELEWIGRREARSQKPEARMGEGLPTLGGEAGRLASSNGLGGMTWGVSTACTSGLMALVEAAMAVRDGEAEKMVAMGADEAGGFVREGFRALKALTVKGCRPFDVERDGLMLGSGAAGCLVGNVESRMTNDESKSKSEIRNPKRRRTMAVCEILGWGVSGDATHMTAPDREAGGLVRAMRGALAMAGLRAGDVDVVFAHGTGTAYNDAMEGVAMERVFLREGARPAVTGVKGLIGHTLGASGMVEALLAVRMIQEQRVPGVYGLREAEREDLDLDLVMRVREMRVRRVMKVASGFGGMNAAVILAVVSGQSSVVSRTGGSYG